MQPCTPRKFNILVAALKTPSDPSRGTVGNPTVSRTGFTLQQTVMANGINRIGGPLSKPPVVSAVNHTAAIKVVTPFYFDPLAQTAATGVLTFGGAPVNDETVTIDGKVYTFRAAINGASVNGDVLNTLVASTALDNLIAAINLGAGAGVTYAAAMTLHPTVSAAAGAGDTMVATAKVRGVAGDALTNATNVTLGSWAPVGTFTGGLDASLTGGNSTGTVMDVLRVLAGATYTVPASTIVQVVVSTFNPQATPLVWNAANFDYTTFKEILVADSSFYLSLYQGQINGFTGTGFHYLGVTSPALVAYDNTGAVL